jgi:short-subunit dehydrogenase
MVHIDNREPKKVEGPRVLVTGASGGLGRALLADCSTRGLTVFGQANQHASGGMIQSNFSIPEDVAKMEQFIVDNNITCVVNNAGLYSNKNITEIADGEIERIVNVNLVAPILLSKYLYKHLLATGQEGWIVNINSLAGKYPNFSESVYCASKFGLSGFGASLSINQKSSKIKVIDIHVGAMKTPMTEGRPNHANLMDPAEISKFVLDTIQSNSQYIPTSVEIRNK